MFDELCFQNFEKNEKSENRKFRNFVHRKSPFWCKSFLEDTKNDISSVFQLFTPRRKVIESWKSAALLAAPGVLNPWHGFAGNSCLDILLGGGTDLSPGGQKLSRFFRLFRLFRLFLDQNFENVFVGFLSHFCLENAPQIRFKFAFFSTF